EQQARSEAELAAIAEMEAAELARQIAVAEAEMRVAQEAKTATERQAAELAQQHARAAAMALELSQSDRDRLERERIEAQKLADELITRIGERGAQHEAWQSRATAVLAEAPVAMSSRKPAGRTFAALAAGLALLVGVAGWNAQDAATPTQSAQSQKLQAKQKNVAEGSVQPVAPARLQMSYELVARPAEAEAADTAQTAADITVADASAAMRAAQAR